MKLEKRRYDDVVILKFAGEFDAFNLPTFSQKIDAMIEAGDRQLVLDLHALKFINSAALGYLIKTNKRVKVLRGEMVLARPSRFIQKTLVTLGLDGVFTAFQTVEDGIMHFKKGESLGKLDLEGGEYDEALTGSVPVLFRLEGHDQDPNQVGRIVTLYDDGLLFRYEPQTKASGKDPVEGDLVQGSKWKIKFRQPFAIKDHYFEMSGTVTQVSKLGASDGEDAVMTIRMRYDRIRDEDRKHLQQFVRDLESWKAELM